MKRVLMLVEGQTEEGFVKTVLAPEFLGRDLIILPTILVTKRTKTGLAHKGGVTSFAKLEGDVRRLLRNPGDALVTTLIDYYGLPQDTPGMSTRIAHRTAVERVQHVETALHVHFGAPRNFLPFLALHEFEAWLLSCTTTLPQDVSGQGRGKDFAAICSSADSPEEVNEQPQTAPSKRILGLYPEFRKTLHGPIVAQKIGLALMRRKCPHLNAWLTRLEEFAAI